MYTQLIEEALTYGIQLTSDDIDNTIFGKHDTLTFIEGGMYINDATTYELDEDIEEKVQEEGYYYIDVEVDGTVNGTFIDDNDNVILYLTLSFEADIEVDSDEWLANHWVDERDVYDRTYTGVQLQE